MQALYPFATLRPSDPGRETVGLRAIGPAAWAARDATKQALSAELLATLVERRLRWLPAVRTALALDACCSPRAGLPRHHERDAAGRNWDLPGFACGTIDETTCRDAFRTVVDRLRDEFDIAG